jgi:rsbT co-antagonist protein RsbR
MGHPVTMRDPATDGAADGASDWWTVYEANFDAVNAALADHARQDPDLQSAVQQRDPAESRAQSQRSRELLRKALLHGEWEEYEKTLRGQGAGYARAGLPLTSWSRLIRAMRVTLLPRLIEAYASEPDRLLAVIRANGDFFDRVLVVLSDEYLRTKEEVIRQQSEALQVLSTPVLRVRDRLLLMPIIGVIDTFRARQLTEALLKAIRSDRARAVVIDITGVPAVDSRVAQHLVQAISAARLMGTAAIVTGLSPDVAQSLVALGIDLGGLRTVGDLQGGLEAAERLVADGVAGAER